MYSGFTVLIAALLGLTVGVVASVAFRWSQRNIHPKMSHQYTPEHDELAHDGEKILETIPQHYILLDETGRVEQASTQAYSYGIVKENRLARPEFVSFCEKVQSTGLVTQGRMKMKRSTLKNQQDTSLNVYAAPLSGGRTLILFEDNTEKIKLEEMRRDFVSNVSHELKTPVGAVALLAETLHEVADEPELVRKFSKDIYKEATRLQDLVQDIIELSRLQEGDALRSPGLIDIDNVIREAVDRMQVEAEERGVAIVEGERTGMQTYGDRKMLATAIRNLLDNAVRYTKKNGRVSIAAHADGDQVCVSVVDQGEGIDPAIQDRIFERFYRGDYARARHEGGSGLGLAIVKHVAQDHGGRVKLWSKKGMGSTFTICLPKATLPTKEA